MTLPAISVIIPVLNSAADLKACLQALQRSNYAPEEIIVVDDGSTDGSREVAVEAGAKLIEMSDTRGPSRARNRGAAIATGEILLFVDADVCVHKDTLEKIAKRLGSEPEWDGLFGSYDDAPGDPAFLSQYRNLMHTYVHQTANPEASTFWCGCGAIRRKVFEESGGFDESVQRSAIEDVMFGRELTAAGRRILLDRDIRVRHLKHWDFVRMVVTDVRQRGIPWVQMTLKSRLLPDDMIVDWPSRISLVLTWVMAVAIVAGAVISGGVFLAPLGALFFLMLGAYWCQKTAGAKGLLVTGGIAAGLAWTLWNLGQLAVILPLVAGYLAFAAMPHFRWAEPAAGLSVAWAWAAALFEWSRTGGEVWLAVGVAAFAVLVWLNRGFYRYLARVRGGVFALGTVLFRLLYHFLNGVSLVAGSAMFIFQGRSDR